MSTFKHFLTAAFVAAFSLPASAEQQFDLGNGSITVNQTEECYYQIDYFNLLDKPEVKEIDLGQVQINIIAGYWDLPEELVVSTVWGWKESHMVEENHGVTVCIPWPVIG